MKIDVESLVDTGADLADVELAARIISAANELQATMDEAARAGLVIEPSFQRYSGKEAEYGVSAESFVCKVKIYRKLI